MQLLDQITQAIHNPESMTVGQVISVSPFQVRLFGDTSGSIPMLSVSGYSPTAGDKVVAAKVGLQWIVLGAYSSSSSPVHPMAIPWVTPQWVSGNIYRNLYGGVPVTSSLTADRIYFSPYNQSHGSGRSIDALVASNTSTDASVSAMAIYESNADGLPGILLDSATSAFSGAYQVFALAADLELTPRTTYWIAVHLATTETLYVADSTAYYPSFRFNLGSATASTALQGSVEGRFYHARSYASGLPDPFPAPADWTSETLAGGQLPILGVRAA
jgi:hypothetical protein